MHGSLDGVESGRLFDDEPIVNGQAALRVRPAVAGRETLLTARDSMQVAEVGDAAVAQV